MVEIIFNVRKGNNAKRGDYKTLSWRVKKPNGGVAFQAHAYFYKVGDAVLQEQVFTSKVTDIYMHRTIDSVIEKVKKDLQPKLEEKYTTKK